MDLLKLSNLEEGKHLLSVLGQRSEYPIVKINHNSFIEKLDKKTYRATFFSKRPIEDLFQPIIDKIQIADEYKPITNQREAFLHYSGLETNYKYPQIFLDTSTFNPASGANSPVDGFASREGQDVAFSTIRAGAGTNASAVSSEDYAARVRDSGTSNQFEILQRAIFLFDTSSLTTNAVISSAIFSLFFTTKDTTLDIGGVNVVASTPAADNTIATGDYSQLGTTRFSSDIPTASVPSSAYGDFTLNASGLAAISLTGISKFGTRSVDDLDNSAPTWVAAGSNGYFLCYFADHGSSLPKLVVTFTLPVANTGSFNFL